MTTPRILVVEDDAVTADSLRGALAQMGHDVLGPVATGKQAVEMAAAGRPDVVLMDVRLRGSISGVEAATRIQKVHDVPVIYLTAYADDALVRQAAATEPYAYLTKPVRERDLAAGIGIALYRSRTDRKLRHLNQVLHAIRDVNRLIARERDAGRMLQQACSILVRARGYHLTWIGKPARDAGRLAPLACAGEGTDLLEAADDGTQGADLPWIRCLATRKPEMCPGTAADEETGGRSAKAAAAVPMLYEKRLFGVLCVHAGDQEFSDEELDLLGEVAADLALGLWGIEQRKERRKAEEQLRRSEEDYRRLFDGAIEGIAVADIETGVILDCNEAFLKLVGCERSELIGRHQSVLHPPDDRVGGVTSSFAAHRGESEGQPLASVLVTKTGERRAVEVTARVQEIGGRPVLHGFFRDVSKRKQAEEEREQQIARIALLSEIARAVAQRLDVSNILHAALQRLEGGLPLQCATIAVSDPDTGDLRIAALGAQGSGVAAAIGLAEGGVCPTVGSFPAGCLDGEVIYIQDIHAATDANAVRLAAAGVGSVVGVPLMAEGKVLGVLGAARREPNAFSEMELDFLRVVAEHISLAVYHARLYQDLQAAYGELKQAQAAAIQQERLRALGQMAGGIAHDFNNALTPIVAYSELLLTAHETRGGDEKTARFLRSIGAAAESAAGTVARLRAFYRPRDADEVYGRVSIDEVLAETVALTQPKWKDEAQARGAEVRVTIRNDGKLVVAGQASELREMLTNLVFNAVDAMPCGGSITIGSRADGDGNVIVEVTDTGIGMNEETRRRCMEPFFTTKGERGTGLGLAMAYGTIQRHKGILEVDSVPGEGTTFRVIFPPYDASSASFAMRPAPADTRPLRILLVDDEAFVRDAIGEFLTSCGHAVEKACNGLEALEVFLVGRFDLVITDRAMPEMGGDQLAAAIKGMDPSQPVIMLTGFGDFMAAHGESVAGADEIIGKPVDLKRFSDAIARAVEER